MYKREKMHCWWDSKVTQTLWQNSMEVSQKIKTRTTIWSSNPTFECVSEERILKRYLYSHIHCSIIHSSQDRETAYISINGWINKDVKYTHIHTHTHIVSSLKKKETLSSVATWMNFMLSEISQSLKDIYYKMPLI